MQEMVTESFLAEVTDAAVAGRGCTAEEARALTRLPLASLVPGATRIRETFFGSTVSFCMILNARSGSCSENCRYCAQSAHHNTEAQTYDLFSAEKIALDAERRQQSGASHYGIVTSGPTVSDDELAEIGRACGLIASSGNVNPCASLGALTVEQLSALKAAGLKRFHHNLETSENFFPQICTTHSYESRVQTMRNAIKAGLEVCSGGLFGLGESWDDRIDLALALRDLGVSSVPVNFLNPVQGTPLENQTPLTADEALRILAVLRYLMPKATLRVCGGRPAVLGDRQVEMFACGANALMTGNYLTTAGMSPDEDRRWVESLGLQIR